jgi:hypothetical protein
MGKLDASKISEIATERAKRTEKLRVLTSTPFSLDNKEHTRALKNYLDSFELTVNQMYLFQAMSAGLATWGGSWIVGFFLPIPDFANYFLTAVLYFGVAGYILERFSMTDFFEQLAEMKTIYNWCLKGAQDNYSSAIDNTQSLIYPDIQRMIKLIAPLCTTEFMLAWRKETEGEEQKGVVSSIISTGYTIVSAPFTLFSSSKKSSVDLNRVRELKVNVETRNFDVGVLNGFKQALEYFATSPDFRELMTAKIRQPGETVKTMIPGAALIEGYFP